MTEYVYVVLWFAVGLLLLFRFGRENKIFYFLGGFFVLLGFWWLADAVTGSSLFTGVWGWVLRGLTAIALLVSCKVYYDETKRSRQAHEDAKQEQAEARRAALSAQPREPLSAEAGAEGDDAPGGGSPLTDSPSGEADEGPFPDAPGSDASNDAPGDGD